jgi:predicted SAM-dependent methyltransferase
LHERGIKLSRSGRDISLEEEPSAFMMRLDFSQTKLRINRSIFSYAKVQFLVSELIRGRTLFVSEPAEGAYLDVGCGPNVREDYCDLDYVWRPGVDICWNICNDLPIKDQWIGGVFSEHCIEHISFDSFCFVARELHRIMKKGSYLRIVVPDGELYMRNYNLHLTGQSVEMPYHATDAIQGIYTPIMSINRIMREHGHCFIYDYETLSAVLAKAGFSEIRRQQYRTGADPKLLLDSSSRNVESVYVEARK